METTVDYTNFSATEISLERQKQLRLLHQTGPLPAMSYGLSTLLSDAPLITKARHPHSLSGVKVAGLSFSSDLLGL